MRNYDTLTAALTDLKSRGFNLDLNIEFDKLLCRDNKISLDPTEFEIVEMYRFEGDTNPSDEDVVYAIESRDGRFRGTVTSAFGLYADSVSTDMIKKLSFHPS